MGTPIGKTTDGSVLSAQTHGETHRQNDTSLAGRPKYTTPYPWRDPYRGIHKGGRREAPHPLYHMGLSMGTGSCIWDARPAMCRFAYGFPHGSEHRALNPLSLCLWVFHGSLNHLLFCLWVSHGSEPCTMELPLGTIC